MSQQTGSGAARAGFGANQWLVDELYEQYQRDRTSVDPAWWDFFEDYTPRAAHTDGANGSAGPAGPADTSPGGSAATSTPASRPATAQGSAPEPTSTQVSGATRTGSSTPPATLSRARRIALDAGLKHVYSGNVHDVEGDTTHCAHCGETLIVRDWDEIRSWRLTAEGACPNCGVRLAGRFGAVGAEVNDAFGARRIPVNIHRHLPGRGPLS